MVRSLFMGMFAISRMKFMTVLVFVLVFLIMNVAMLVQMVMGMGMHMGVFVGMPGSVGMDMFMDMGVDMLMFMLMAFFLMIMGMDMDGEFIGGHTAAVCTHGEPPFLNIPTVQFESTNTIHIITLTVTHQSRLSS